MGKEFMLECSILSHHINPDLAFDITVNIFDDY